MARDSFSRDAARRGRPTNAGRQLCHGVATAQITRSVIVTSVVGSAREPPCGCGADRIPRSSSGGGPRLAVETARKRRSARLSADGPSCLHWFPRLKPPRGAIQGPTRY